MISRRSLVAATLLFSACGSSSPPPNPDLATPLDLTPPPDLMPPQACSTATTATIATVGKLEIGRYSPVGASLQNGLALIAGGYDFTDGIEVSAQLFHPITNVLSEAKPLNNGRNFASTVTLSDNRLFIAGGFDPSFGSLLNAETFDPTTNTFTQITNEMSVGREAHTATTLPDGRVLIAGGLQSVGFKFHDTAELFDPKSGTFTLTQNHMSAPRAYQAAIYLAKKQNVFIVGGDSGNGELPTAERFDPTAQTFTLTANMLAHKSKALAAALLQDGRVLVAGGANATDGTLSDAAIYDPTTDQFTPVAPMATRRIAFQLTTLTDGRVLASGGFSDTPNPRSSTPVLELFDPTTNTWTTLTPKLAQPRHDHVALLLSDCRVLIAGGQQVIGAAAPVAPLELEAITIPHPNN